MPVVTDHTALISGNSWMGIELTARPVVITYSFPTLVPSYLDQIGGLNPSTSASFAMFSDGQKVQARQALAQWAAASGLVFLEVPPGQGDINFHLLDFNDTAYAGSGGIGFYPFGKWDGASAPYFNGDLDLAGDVFMNSRLATADSVDAGTLLHEIGHAIGLKHPTEVVTNYAAWPPVVHDQVLANNDPALTVMAGGPGGGGTELKQFDKDAAAHLYGAAGTGAVVTTSSSGANGFFSWSWNAATQKLTQTGLATDDAIRGSSVKDIIYGLAGHDRLYGLAGDDILEGGDGNDVLDGGAGNDTMRGGKGDDIYIVNSLADVFEELKGEGTDTVRATVSVSLASKFFENVELQGTANINATGNNGVNQLWGNAGNNVLIGLLGADIMTGGLGDDTYGVDNVGDLVFELAGEGHDTVRSSISYSLVGRFIEDLQLTGTANVNAIGNAFVNRLTGNAGNNTIDGGGGADTMAGGQGDDIYMVDFGPDLDEPGDIVLEYADEGTDTVRTSVSYYLSNFVENLELLGSMNIRGGGNNLANRLTGNSGNNLLNGLGGADLMIGGDGDDIYVLDDPGDRIIELDGEGSDTVQTTMTYSLGNRPFLENLTLTGTAAIDGTGNASSNRLTGNSGNNRLDGKGGADRMAGGMGDDTYIVDDAGDVIVESNGAGNDTVRATVSFSIEGAYVETLVLASASSINGTGNSLANTINGGSGNNIIDGLLNSDILKGGGGTDTFVFSTVPHRFNIDTIVDFSSGEQILLQRSAFNGFTTAGALAADGFKNLGLGVVDATDRVLYDPSRQMLSYDPDGSGSKAAIDFAILNNGYVPTADDFLIG